jgi:hypothetical protein
MSDDRDYLERKVREELEAEGEDQYSIWQKTETAIREIIRRIAEKLGRAVDEIWEILRKLGGK